MEPTPAAPTPYPGLNAVLRELLGAVRTVFGDDLVGLYLQGSFAVGDFDEVSDADFIVVTRAEPTDVHVADLRVEYGRVFDLEDPWAKHLEGSFLPADVLRDRRRAGEPVWYFDHGHRDLERSDHCNTVVVRWTLREHGVRLVGPAPAGLIDPIPVEALREEIRTTAVVWGRMVLAEPDRWANRFYQGFIVLSYARILHDLNAGSVGSKRTGAEWMKRREPRFAGLIDRAWGTRPDPARSYREPADPEEYRRTMAFLRFVVGECERFVIPGRRQARAT
jgi:predicted nucleotidyltransferase